MRVEYNCETGASGGRTWRERLDLLPQSLPTWQSLRQWSAAYTESRVAKRALWRERRISGETGVEYGIGWDANRQAWVLPVWDEWGSLVNCTWRPRRGRAIRWNGKDIDHPMRIAGRRVENGCLPLWPHVPEGDVWLLCAGEWDALAALQHGLPALTGLAGCRWHPAWDSHAVGKAIAVAYDVGEEAAATRTVAQLMKAGAAEAWSVPLARLGLGDGGDLCDYFLRRGSMRALRRVIREARHVG